MYHSGAEDLHPASSFTARAAGAVTELALHVHFCRRLGEREVARPETRSGFAEEFVGEVRQSRLEVDEADSFIDRQPLDLREHRRVRGVEEIATVGVAGTQDANRRLELLHGADMD